MEPSMSCTYKSWPQSSAMTLIYCSGRCWAKWACLSHTIFNYSWRNSNNIYKYLKPEGFCGKERCSFWILLVIFASRHYYIQSKSDAEEVLLLQALNSVLESNFQRNEVDTQSFGFLFGYLEMWQEWMVFIITSTMFEQHRDFNERNCN